MLKAKKSQTQETRYGAPLVVQWIRICLPNLGTWGQFLVQEDSTCCIATKARVPQLLSLCAANTEVHTPRACALQQESRLNEKPMHHNEQRPCSLQLEKVKAKLLSRVWLFATPWIVAYQAPQSIECSRQEYWSGLPFPSPGDLPNPGIEPGSLALQADARSTIWATKEASRENLPKWQRSSKDNLNNL